MIALDYFTFVNFRAEKFSRTSSTRKLEIIGQIYFRVPSTKLQNFGTNFRAISRKSLAKTTFLYSFFQNFKFENFAYLPQSFKNSVLIFAQFVKIESLRKNVRKYVRTKICTNKVEKLLRKSASYVKILRVRLNHWNKFRNSWALGGCRL